MSALSLPLRGSAFGIDGWALKRVAGEAIQRQPVLAGSGIVLLAAMAPTLFAWAIDARTLYGIDIWIKPMKFEASVALYFLTLAWMWGYLAPRLRQARAVRAVAMVLAASGLLEVIYIAGQAARGVASHFNETTPLEALLFQLMGVGAVILTAGSLVLAILIARSGRGERSPAFHAAVIAGLGLTFVLGTGAGIAIAANGGHWVGGIHSDIGGLPILGWARDGGDLRVAHFFGIHAMQILPVFALLAERILPRRAGIALAIFTLGFVAVTIAALLQAQAGRPFLPGLG